jgi:hypothetical protein
MMTRALSHVNSTAATPRTWYRLARAAVKSAQGVAVALAGLAASAAAPARGDVVVTPDAASKSNARPTRAP